MKVLSFLQVVQLGVNSKEYYEYCVKGLAKILDNIEGQESFDIVDFYSQPFKPELITELFEGWRYEWNKETSCRTNYVTMIGEEKITLIFDFQWKCYWKSVGFAKYYFPRTLDDFINDCQRAGIELEWKL